MTDQAVLIGASVAFWGFLCGYVAALAVRRAR